MAFIKSIILLLVLAGLAYALVWFYYKSLSQKKDSTLSELDKDLLKINESANIHRSRGLILVLAFFIVGVYTFKLITHEDEIIHIIEPPKTAPVGNTVANEIDNKLLEIPDPEPQKQEVVFTPKVVSNNTEIKNEPVTAEEEEEEEENEPGLKPKTEEKTSKEAPKNVVVDNPTVLPKYINGGEPGLESKLFKLLEGDISKLDPGFYAVPLEFVVEVNGAVTGVRIAPDEEVENQKIADLVIKAFKNIGIAGAFSPGNNDGQTVRVRMQKPFFIEIQ